MNKYYGIEFLRFLTSFTVLLYHYRLFFNPYNPYSSLIYDLEKIRLPFYNLLEIFYSKGIYGVHVFYTISGFVFAHIYLSLKDSVSGKEFFVNRFARLYPLHFATLIIVTLLLFLNLYLNNSFQIDPSHKNDLYHFSLHLFFISSWGFEFGHSFNTPIWSVSVEIAIYGIFFILLYYIKKFKLYFTIFFIIILSIIGKSGLIDSLFLECARLFFSGVLVYFINQKVKKKTYIIFISIFLLIISVTGNFKTYLFCPSLLLLFVSIEDKITSNYLKKIFAECGNLTYSLYLLHYPLILFLIIIQKKFNISDLLYLKFNFFIIYFVTLILISYYSFKLYEKPLNKKIRFLFFRKK